MRPLDVVKQAEGMQLQDKRGNVTTLKLLPPLSEDEMQALERRPDISVIDEISCGG